MKCEWQPIETAPKDGTEVLLKVKANQIGSGAMVGEWDSDNSMWRAYTRTYGYKDGLMIVAQVCNFWFLADAWCPLPANDNTACASDSAPDTAGKGEGVV